MELTGILDKVDHDWVFTFAEKVLRRMTKLETLSMYENYIDDKGFEGK